MRRSTLLPTLLAFALVLSLVLSGIQPVAASLPSAPTHPNLAALTAKVQAQGSVRLIVMLNTPFQLAGELASNMDAANAQDTSLYRAQDGLLARLPGVEAQSVKKFTIIPGLALQVDAAGLAALAANPAVTHIEEDVPEPVTLAQSVPLIGAPTVWADGYTGTGQTVAILDTGVDKSHPFLAGKVVSEACYSTTNASSGATSICPGGVNTTAVGSAMPYTSGICQTGDCDHGTHVAGIAAGNDPGSLGYSGVAKNATIIAVQVFSNFSSGVGSYPSDQILGLQRVLALKNDYAISSVNMSLGGGSNSSNCDVAQAARKTAIDNLRSVGVATIISSGNDGYTSAIGAPACISSAISVGSTGDGSDGASVDVVSSFSNSASILTLLAPGEWITSSLPNSTYDTWDGTSMAAPHVTGAWAVLRSKFPAASVNQILTAITSTGLPVSDYRNSIVKPRIRLDQAANGPYTISGKVTTNGTTPVAGVTLSTGTISTTTAADGTYTLSGLISGSYTLTPSKAGLTFSPANSAATVGPNQTGINFTAVTYTVAGNITLNGAPGLSVQVNDNAGHSAITDINGNYMLSGLLPGSYTVTPSKAEFTFSPANRPVSVGPNATGISFAGTQITYTISGRITLDGGFAVAGVLVSDGAGHSATTDAQGYYTISGVPAGVYTVTPTKTLYTFSPVNRSVTVGASKTGIDFTGTTALYSVSGHVTTSGPAGLVGVLISDGLGRSTLTAADGSYTLSNLPAGDYTLLPLKVGYAMSPFKRTFTITNTNPPDQNFTAAVGGHFTFLPTVRK